MITTTLSLLLLLCVAPPARAAVVTFTGKNYTGYETWNWTAMTHLGFWHKPPPPVVALANQHDVRLYLDGHLPDQKQWTNADPRRGSGGQARRDA